MIKYHGTPLTPRATLHTLAGRNFCVSYAEPRDIDICHEIGQSVMLDNGAFTFWTQKRETDWPGYYSWADRWLDHWSTWAVIPDLIDGDEAANDRLILQWPFGERGAPVYHLHESLDRLRRLCDKWPLVCIGSSGDYATIDTAAWRQRMAEAMDVACDQDGLPWTRLHMLRGLQFVDGPYPFYSADSTNVARNHAGTNSGRARKSALRMASEIDGRTPASRWRRLAAQEELVA